MAKVLKLMVGAVAGYVVYWLLALGYVLVNAARLHYFDTEMLRGLTILPVGLLGALFTDANFPGWIWVAGGIAYALVALGAVVAWLWSGRRSPSVRRV